MRLLKKTMKKLNEVAEREGKDRSALIREMLERGVNEKDLDRAIELYRTGQTQAGGRPNWPEYPSGTFTRS